MLKDRYGSPITTTSKDARDAYVEGIDRFIGAMDGVDDAYRTAIAADENFAMAHLGLARYFVTTGRGADAKAELAIARNLATNLTMAAQQARGLRNFISDLRNAKSKVRYTFTRKPWSTFSTWASLR